MKRWGENLLLPTILGLGVFGLLWGAFSVIFGADLKTTLDASFFAFAWVDFTGARDWTHSWIHRPPALLTHLSLIAAGYVTARTANRVWFGLLPGTLVGLGIGLLTGLWIIITPLNDTTPSVHDYLRLLGIYVGIGFVLSGFGTAIAGAVRYWRHRSDI